MIDLGTVQSGLNTTVRACARKVGVCFASSPTCVRPSQTFFPRDVVGLERGKVHEDEVALEPAQHPAGALELTGPARRARRPRR